MHTQHTTAFSFCQDLAESFSHTQFWSVRDLELTKSATLQFTEFEKQYRRSVLALDRALELDTLESLPEIPDIFPQMPGEISPGVGKRGGKIDRPPPPLEILRQCVPPGGTRHRWDKIKGVPEVTDIECAKRVHLAYVHRGRKCGLSERDYDFQAEWTEARSLTFKFFLSDKKKEDPVPMLPLSLGFLTVGKGGNHLRRNNFLGCLCEAFRMGKNGITASIKEIAGYLKCNETTAWKEVKWLERKGLIVRMRRYKPNIKDTKNKAPVSLSRNWYGMGPTLLKYRLVFATRDQQKLMEEEAKEKKEELIPRSKVLTDYYIEFRRSVARKRRQSYWTKWRYENPGQLPPVLGSTPVDRIEFAQMVLNGAKCRQELRQKLWDCDEQFYVEQGELMQAIFSEGFSEQHLELHREIQTKYEKERDGILEEGGDFQEALLSEEPIYVEEAEAFLRGQETPKETDVQEKESSFAPRGTIQPTYDIPLKGLNIKNYKEQKNSEKTKGEKQRSVIAPKKINPPYLEADKDKSTTNDTSSLRNSPKGCLFERPPDKHSTKERCTPPPSVRESSVEKIEQAVASLKNAELRRHLEKYLYVFDPSD